MRFGSSEDLAQHRQKRLIGRIVGPQGEDPARMEVSGEMAQSGRFVEGTVARVQEVAR